MSKNHFYDDRIGETIVNMDGLREQVGKYIFVESVEDNSTRVYIRKPSAWRDIDTKSGWWDIFTLSTKPCSKGIYMAKITDLKKDKDNNPIFIVEIGAEVGSGLVDKNFLSFQKPYPYAVHRLLKLSGLFSDEAGFNEFNLDDRYNIGALKSALKIEGTNVEEQATKMLFRGEVTWKEMANHLDTLFDNEKEAFDLFSNLEKFSEKFPLLVKKATKFLDDNKLSGKYFSYKFDGFLEDLAFSYMELYKSGKITRVAGSRYEKAECVLSYYDEIHKAQKAAKKAKKQNS